MRIAYIAAAYPFTTGEQFLGPEIRAISTLGHDIVLAPARPRSETAAEGLPIGVSIVRARGPIGNLLGSLSFALRRLPQMRLVFRAFVTSPRHIPKNVLVLPKAIWLAHELARRDVQHIHAHWLSTSATVAMIVSTLLGLPYSITVHRWDIVDGNMATWKGRTAKFIRFISHSGYEMWHRNFPPPTRGVVIPMGVDIPKRVNIAPPERSSHIVVPAALVPVKGHRVLVEAAQEMVSNGVPVQIDLIGEGPLKHEIAALIAARDLENHVRMIGRLSHSELLHRYRRGGYSIVVLPSVDLRSGRHEGVPVALMEAMAYGIVPVATRTGGIPELVDDQVSGLLVDHSNVGMLSLAIGRLVGDAQFRDRLRRGARQSVRENFDVLANSEALVREMEAG